MLEEPSFLSTCPAIDPAMLPNHGHSTCSLFPWISVTQTKLQLCMCVTPEAPNVYMKQTVLWDRVNMVIYVFHLGIYVSLKLNTVLGVVKTNNISGICHRSVSNRITSSNTEVTCKLMQILNQNPIWYQLTHKRHVYHPICASFSSRQWGKTYICIFQEAPPFVLVNADRIYSLYRCR